MLSLELVEVFEVVIVVVVEVDIGGAVVLLVLRRLHETFVLKVVLVLRDFLLLDNVNFFLELCHRVR